MKAENITELQRLLSKRKMVNCWLEADLIRFIDELLKDQTNAQENKPLPKVTK